MAPDDRRDQGRAIAAGQVLLLFSDPVVSAIEADLRDASEAGFRARHSERRLVSGLQVRFSWHEGAGTAVVVWTRQLGTHLESGFSINETWPSQ
jgi:hypothetical protein